MMSLEFFIGIILPVTLWPWGKLSRKQIIEYQGYFRGWEGMGKGGRYVGRATLPLSFADCLESWELHPTETLKACPDLCKDCFTCTDKFISK
jgi:hypothetical protein